MENGKTGVTDDFPSGILALFDVSYLQSFDWRQRALLGELSPMLELQLRQQLTNVAMRIARLRMWRQLAWLWALFTVLVLAWLLIGRPLISPLGWFSAAAGVGLFVWYRSSSSATPRAEIARTIEDAFPDLNSRLLAAIEQAPDLETGRMNVMQRQLIAEAIHHARMNDWTDAVPPRSMRRAFWGQAAALAVFLVVGLLGVQATAKSASAKAKFSPVGNGLAQDANIVVEPGNADLERGSSLLIFARFLDKPPAEVQVNWKGADGVEHLVPLTKSLDDPVFATRLSTVNEDLSYRIQYDGRQTVDYRITVYDLPSLVRSDLSLVFPTYTGLEPKSLPDAFEASVVEGTQITITCHVNKPLVSAKLVTNENLSFDLEPVADDPLAYRLQLIPDRKMRLKLELADTAGRKNRNPEEFRIDVVPNRPPELKLAFPAKDVKVSPLEEMQIEAAVFDDFAVLEAGLSLQVAGRDPITVPLGQNLKGGQQHRLQVTERLEEFRVQPDELVTYYIYAIDHGPDGKPRLTSSDMYFAEVRSFDEIYRQIDQQGAGEMQNSQKPPDSLAKLLELQKQVIVASWKLVRQVNPAWTAEAGEQVKVIREGQAQAIQKLEALRERMSQPQLQPTFNSVADSMKKAERELAQSLAEQSFTPLRPAAGFAQSAYQSLLKLRAKEHLLMQAKSKGSGQENEEKEKFDLELKRNQNRYESEKQAANKEDSNVNRQALAILDRLKELASRQDDINEQIKDLESQMRQAKTDAEREELDRRLKRLREEQQQLLHDADELRNKLNNSSLAEVVAEAKQQLEQTRQHLVDTAEKLREGQLSQALASGTRAERELKQLQEDFRKQTAALFADAMRKLREEARQLAEREKQLGEQLSHLDDQSRRTLRQSQENAQLQAEFQQQRQQAEELLEKAKQIVEQSEAPEPLLSRQLYETLRSSREAKLEQALNATQQLLKQGIVPEAIKAEQQASKGIEQLKQGIERAAESVLGNEVESLKRARRELADLSDQLEKEISAQDKQGKSDQPSKSSQPGDGQEGQSDSKTPNESKAPGDSKSAGADGKPSGNAGEKNGPPGESNSPGQTPGQSPGSQGQSPQGGQGQSPGQGSGQGKSSPGSDQNPGSEGGSSDATAPTTPSSEGNAAPGERKSALGLRTSKSPNSSGKPGPGRNNPQSEGDNSESGGNAGNSQGGGPLTGSNYSEFNERLREVESMISDPQIQAEVQKVRDRARSARAEFKRHTQTPNWDLVRTSVHQPMIELQQRLKEEIAKRESPDSMVPVDRDPVPTKYRDLVRSYYERLGSGKDE